VNASATLNTNKGQEAFGVEAASNCGPLHLQPLSKDKSPQPGAPLAKLPICGSKIRRIFPNANYSDPPAALAACGQGRVAAKRNKWRGPAQRGGGRLCRLRVSLRAGCQSSTPARTYFWQPIPAPKRSQNGISRAKTLASQCAVDPWLSINAFEVGKERKLSKMRIIPTQLEARTDQTVTTRTID
jgi:hypothetical protein